MERNPHAMALWVDDSLTVHCAPGRMISIREGLTMEILWPLTLGLIFCVILQFGGLPVFIVLGLGTAFLLKLWGDRA